MAILGASFQIGRSALAAYQAAISVTGQNIANVGNPDYTRQTGQLSALPGSAGTTLSAGAGVQMSALQRHVDSALEDRLRQSISDSSAADTTHSYFSQIETLYGELSDTDLSTQLSDFYSALGSLQADPQAGGQRTVAVTAANTLVNTLQRQRAGLTDQITQMNDDAQSTVNDLNSEAQQVGQLNETIAVQESDGQTVASSLRDQRDALLRQMAENADVTVRFLDNGTANVYVGSEPLVEYNRTRTLELNRNISDGFEVAQVRFADNKSAAVFSSGKLAGIVNTRDQQVVGQIDQLDQLARGIIYDVNRVQSSGRGATGLTTADGAYAVGDPAAALNSAAAGLTYPVQNGTFIVNVRDTESGQTITRQIDVDLDGLGTDTSLQDLATQLAGVPGLQASVTSDHRLSVQAASGSEFWFTDDSSGALAALGVNSLFTGTNAGNIAVAAAVTDNPQLIATGQTAAQDDGSNAALFGQLAAHASTQLNGLSASDFHARQINQLAVETAGANTAYESASAVHDSMQAQRESISGVSLDEETLNLTVYQRAFEGASRFLNVVQSLSEELMSLLK